MIGAAELALLRDGATVVNTARGALIDTDALVRECASGRLDAILDVTDPEPLPDDSPLYDLPNVSITPHISGDRKSTRLNSSHPTPTRRSADLDDRRGRARAAPGRRDRRQHRARRAHRHGRTGARVRERAARRDPRRDRSRTTSRRLAALRPAQRVDHPAHLRRSEEHTSELQSPYPYTTLCRSG